MRTPNYLILSALAVLNITPLLADQQKLNRLETLHGQLDANGDGVVSNQEYLDFWEQRFKRMDKNQDGLINGSDDSAAGLKAAGANGDGAVSLTETLELRQGDDYEVVFRSTKKLHSAELVSTTDTGVTGSRTWVQTPLSKPVSNGRNWKVSAQIPAGSTAWFINVKHGDLVVSSDFTEAN